MASTEMRAGETRPLGERREIADFEPVVQHSIELARMARKAALTKFGIYQAEAKIDTTSHDESFAVDAPVEEVIAQVYKKGWEKGQRFGFVTEEQGIVLPPDGKAEWIMMWDPVDGSRTAQAGDEQATVTMVGVKGEKRDDPKMKDIEFGVTVALKEKDQMFVSDKTGVYQIDEAGKVTKMKPIENITNDMSQTNLVWEFFSTNMDKMGTIMAPLTNSVRSSMVYPCGSYGALSVIRQGKIHADVRKKAYDEFGDRTEIVKKGTKVVKFLTPMDVGAQYNMIKQLGGVVTDANGKSLDEKALWMLNENNEFKLEGSIDWVAAPTPELHRQTLIKLNEGFANFRDSLTPASN